MADSIIILPPVATTSGDLLDATAISVGGVTVKRERMVIGNDTSSHVATVSSSGALRTLSDISGSFPLIITGSVITAPSSNETVVLSSPTSLSSGLVTLSSNPTVISASSGFVQVYQSTSPWAITGTVLSASSGLVQISGTPTILSASSGLVQVLQSTGVWAISGVVSLSSGTVVLVASSGGAIPATSSGGLGVTILGGAAGGSTAVTLIGSTGQAAVVTSSGGLSVAASFSATSTASNIIGSTGTTAGVSSGGGLYSNIVSSGGIFAPVTSSAGLIVTLATGAGSGAGSTAVTIIGTTGVGWVITSGGVGEVAIASIGGINAPVTSSEGLSVSFPTRQLTHLFSTPAVVTLFQITTLPARLYSISVLTTQTTLNYMEFYGNGTTSLTVASTFLVLANPITVGAFYNAFYSGGGVSCTGGIAAINRLTIGSTVGSTISARYNIEYSV